MNRSFLRPGISFVLALVLITLFCPFAHAHPGAVRGGEDVGWNVDANCHTNGTALTYSFDSYNQYLTPACKSAVNNGAKMWSGTVTITNKTDGTGAGRICTYPGTQGSAIARFDNPRTVSGHLVSWEIQINTVRVSSINDKIMAHEFGHAIGLIDLRETRNRQKLMYGNYDNWTSTGLTDSDKWGARVITGDHSTHSFGYSFYQTDANSANWHKCYCTACGGIKSTGKCTYGTNNRCKLCGVPKGQQTSGIKINPAE